MLQTEILESLPDSRVQIELLEQSSVLSSVLSMLQNHEQEVPLAGLKLLRALCSPLEAGDAQQARDKRVAVISRTQPELIPAVVQLLAQSSTADHASEQVHYEIGVVKHLVFHNYEVKESFCTAGGEHCRFGAITPLMEITMNASPGSIQRQNALWILKSLCDAGPDSVATKFYFIESGAIDVILELLASSPCEKVSAQCAGIVWNLATDRGAGSEDAAKHLLRGGAIDVLEQRKQSTSPNSDLAREITGAMTMLNHWRQSKKQGPRMPYGQKGRPQVRGSDSMEIYPPRSRMESNRAEPRMESGWKHPNPSERFESFNPAGLHVGCSPDGEAAWQSDGQSFDGWQSDGEEGAEYHHFREAFEEMPNYREESAIEAMPAGTDFRVGAALHQLLPVEEAEMPRDREEGSNFRDLTRPVLRTTRDFEDRAPAAHPSSTAASALGRADSGCANPAAGCDAYVGERINSPPLEDESVSILLDEPTEKFAAPGEDSPTLAEVVSTDGRSSPTKDNATET